jgi:hypothetical protein
MGFYFVTIKVSVSQISIKASKYVYFVHENICCMVDSWRRTVPVRWL